MLSCIWSTTPLQCMLNVFWQAVSLIKDSVLTNYSWLWWLASVLQMVCLLYVGFTQYGVLLITDIQQHRLDSSLDTDQSSCISFRHFIASSTQTHWVTLIYNYIWMYCTNPHHWWTPKLRVTLCFSKLQLLFVWITSWDVIIMESVCQRQNCSLHNYWTWKHSHQCLAKTPHAPF